MASGNDEGQGKGLRRSCQGTWGRWVCDEEEEVAGSQILPAQVAFLQERLNALSDGGRNLSLV